MLPRDTPILPSTPRASVQPWPLSGADRDQLHQGCSIKRGAEPCDARKPSDLFIAGFAALGVMFALLPAKAAGTVNLLTWEGYADQSFVKPYEQQSGCKVTATYVGSNDEMVAKLVGGHASVDLVSPSNDTTMD